MPEIDAISPLISLYSDIPYITISDFPTDFKPFGLIKR